MTSKDYAQIADILRRISTGIDRVCGGSMDIGTLRMQFESSFVANVADELAESNPKFDRERFIKAVLG
jgi:hypothetical protein